MKNLDYTKEPFAVLAPDYKEHCREFWERPWLLGDKGKILNERFPDLFNALAESVGHKLELFTMVKIAAMFPEKKRRPLSWQHHLAAATTAAPAQ